MFRPAARFPKKTLLTSPTARAKADEIQRQLELLALRFGLEPTLNVVRQDAGYEIRIGISDELDFHLRETPGNWEYH